MLRLPLIVVLLLISSGCASLQAAPACAEQDYGAHYQCLLALAPERLGLTDPAQRKQLLLYAEKLDQDRRLEQLSERDAFAALAARREQLNRDPAGALQCARFAERILCY